MSTHDRVKGIQWSGLGIHTTNSNRDTIGQAWDATRRREKEESCGGREQTNSLACPFQFWLLSSNSEKKTRVTRPCLLMAGSHAVNPPCVHTDWRRLCKVHGGSFTNLQKQILCCTKLKQWPGRLGELLLATGRRSKLVGFFGCARFRRF